MAVKTNRNYKDSVFTSYFSEKKERLIEVYNALEGTSYPAETEIEINTLEDVLYMNRMNDLSFVIDGKLIVMLEHQSTVSQNMPVRFLLYIARVYEKIITEQNMYRRSKFKIPRPDFIVLYDGEEEYSEQDRLLLSDSFEGAGDEKRLLELEARVYNINRGQNTELVAKSEALNDYSLFVSRVRANRVKSGWDLDKSVGEAVAYCIKHGIMSEFLGKHSSEVVNMLFGEWDMDVALAVRFEEGIESGSEKRAECAAINGLKKGLSVEDVSEISELSIARVKELQARL